MAEGAENMQAVKRRTGCGYIINCDRFDNRLLDSGLKLEKEKPAALINRAADSGKN